MKICRVRASPACDGWLSHWWAPNECHDAGTRCQQSVEGCAGATKGKVRGSSKVVSWLESVMELGWIPPSGAAVHYHSTEGYAQLRAVCLACSKLRPANSLLPRRPTLAAVVARVISVQSSTPYVHRTVAPRAHVNGRQPGHSSPTSANDFQEAQAATLNSSPPHSKIRSFTPPVSPIRRIPSARFRPARLCRDEPPCQ